MVTVPLHYLQNASSFINFWAALCDNIYHRFSSENISCLVLLSSNISKSSLKTSSLASPPSLTVSLSLKLNKLNPEYSTILLDHNKSPYQSLTCKHFILSVRNCSIFYSMPFSFASETNHDFSCTLKNVFTQETLVMQDLNL